MKKAKPPARGQEMLPEYDFSNAVRGKYYARFRQGSNIVVLVRRPNKRVQATRSAKATRRTSRG